MVGTLDSRRRRTVSRTGQTRVGRIRVRPPRGDDLAMASHAATVDLFPAQSGDRSERAAGRVRGLARPALIAAAAALLVALVLTALPGAYDAVAEGVARLPHGNLGWILLGVGLEALSFLGHIVLFRAVFLDRSSRVGYGASYDITMAGHAATRLLGAAGAGGIALTVWALRAAGIPTRTIASRMAAFLVLLYSFFALSVAVIGLGLGVGILPGGGSAALTLLPGLAALGVAATVVAAVAMRRRTRGAPAGAEEPGDDLARPGLAGKVAAAARGISGGGQEAVAIVRR